MTLPQNYKNAAESNFQLLRQRLIIDILDGDTVLGKYQFSDDKEIAVSMPYLNGMVICEIATSFGLPLIYPSGGGGLSRWQYFDQLLEHCAKKNSISNLMFYLLDKQKFISKLSYHSPDEIEVAYNHIVKTVLEAINGILYFGGHELTKIGDRFVVRELNNDLKIQAPNIVKTHVDLEYIKSIYEGAMEDINRGRFDSAITKSRTLLEETFCHVIEQQGESPCDVGDIGKLYTQVKNLYNMHTSPDTDKRINKLLSGLEKIVQAIAELRNNEGDAHGHGSTRKKVKDYHTRLIVNSAVTMADFILAVAEARDSLKKET